MSEVGQSDAATGNAEAPVKTAKQLEKEAKKAEKLAKLQEKQKKLAEKKAAEPAEKEVSSCVCICRLTTGIANVMLKKKHHY